MLTIKKITSESIYIIILVGGIYLMLIISGFEGFDKLNILSGIDGFKSLASEFQSFLNFH